MNELLSLSAKELANKISTGEVTPTDCVEAHIVQIEKVNPDLNAMVEDDFKQARKTAQTQTEVLAKSKTPAPLFGVPFTVKEMFAYKDFKCTAGSVHLKDSRQSQDATIVSRLRKAGGIPLGTTNVPELGFWFETYNAIYGRTNNPYDLERTPGGSSGGEGALIAAGASPFGLGSDIGGSIRIPAAYCGIFGHKPSRYMLPLTGHFPFFENVITQISPPNYPYTSSGILARKAEDLRFILNIIKGPDAIDAQTQEMTIKDSPQSWKGRKVLICPFPRIHLATGVSHEIAEAVRACGEFFEQNGAEVEELDERFFLNAVKIWFAALRSTKAEMSFSEMLGNGKTIPFAKEFARLVTGRGHYTLPNMLLSFGEVLEKKFRKTPADLKEPIAALQKLVNGLKEKLGPEGILICPAQPNVAPLHGALLWTPFDYIYSGIFTMMGVPSTVAPIGLNNDNLPKCVQIISNHGNDHLTITCAEVLEQTFGGWQPPTTYS